MATGADPDSLEANWSRSTLFAKAGQGLYTSRKHAYMILNHLNSTVI